MEGALPRPVPRAGATDLEIRSLIEADATVYRELRLRALREEPEPFGQTYAEAAARPLSATAERLRAQVASGDSFTLGAFDGALVGVVTLVREAGAKSRHKALIVGMYVAPEARRRGVGRALLAETIARARRVDGLEQLHLAVVTTNTEARRLYRSLGFEVYGVEPRALKEGERAWDEELMVLRLRPA